MSVTQPGARSGLPAIAEPLASWVVLDRLLRRPVEVVR